jgi:hypothetical protein
MLSNLEMTSINYYGMKCHSQAEIRRQAAVLFNTALGRARARTFWAKLTGKTNLLRSLPEHASGVRSSRSSRVVTIALKRIVGSESRSLDFDTAFDPCKPVQRERWISILAAQRMGVALPPVELIQVGNEYFVRDGHHRISVARTMGQMEIEALIVN